MYLLNIDIEEKIISFMKERNKNKVAIHFDVMNVKNFEI